MSPRRTNPLRKLKNAENLTKLKKVRDRRVQNF